MANHNSLIAFPKGTLDTPAKFQKAVVFIDKAKDLIKQGEGLMRAHVKEHGNMTLPDGREWGAYVKPKDTIEDTQAAVQGLISLGADKAAVWKALYLAPGIARSLAKKIEASADEWISSKPTKTHGIVPTDPEDLKY